MPSPTRGLFATQFYVKSASTAVAYCSTVASPGPMLMLNAFIMLKASLPTSRGLLSSSFIANTRLVSSEKCHVYFSTEDLLDGPELAVEQLFQNENVSIKPGHIEALYDFFD